MTITTETLQQAIISASILLPILTGIIAAIRQAFNIPSRWVPLLSVILGIILSLLFMQLTVYGALIGIICGLGATGLWEFGKTTVAGK